MVIHSLARSSSVLFFRATASPFPSYAFVSPAPAPAHVLLPFASFSMAAWIPSCASACSFPSSTPNGFAARFPHSYCPSWLSLRARFFNVNNGGMFSMETSSNREREIMVQHLLVKEDQLRLLLDLQQRITQSGADLGELAGEYSICPSKTEGGMLGWMARGQSVHEFEEAAFSAPLNKVVRVKTKHGWHLLQVLSEREASFLKEIQPEDLHVLMQDANFMDKAQLLDVRESDEISIAELKGFKAYPLSQFGRWAPTICEDLDPAKDTYVLCHHGIRSMQAANWLKSQGFQRLFNVAGGIHAYAMIDTTIAKY